eukprot:jgi/Chlat1/5257/Chrsp33S05090
MPSATPARQTVKRVTAHVADRRLGWTWAAVAFTCPDSEAMEAAVAWPLVLGFGELCVKGYAAWQQAECVADKKQSIKQFNAYLSVVHDTIPQLSTNVQQLDADIHILSADISERFKALELTTRAEFAALRADFGADADKRQVQDFVLEVKLFCVYYNKLVAATLPKDVDMWSNNALPLGEKLGLQAADYSRRLQSTADTVDDINKFSRFSWVMMRATLLIVLADTYRLSGDSVEYHKRLQEALHIVTLEVGRLRSYLTRNGYALEQELRPMLAWLSIAGRRLHAVTSSPSVATVDDSTASTNVFDQQAIAELQLLCSAGSTTGISSSLSTLEEEDAAARRVHHVFDWMEDARSPLLESTPGWLLMLDMLEHGLPSARLLAAAGLMGMVQSDAGIEALSAPTAVITLFNVATSSPFSRHGEDVCSYALQALQRLVQQDTVRAIILANNDTAQLTTSLQAAPSTSARIPRLERLLHVLGVRTWQGIAVLSGHTDSVQIIKFSPDGSTLATASCSTAMLWDVSSGRRKFVLEGESIEVFWLKVPSGNDTFGCVAWRPDGRMLAVATTRNFVEWSPDGQTLATASDDCTAALYNPKTGQQVWVLRGHTKVVYRAVWSSDGKLLATASMDGTAAVWDAASGKRLHVLSHSGFIANVAWSPDSRMLAATSGDNTATLWNSTSGKRLHVLAGHGGLVHSVAWSPDGRLLATASSDCTARLWDSASGREVRVLSGHSDWVRDAIWSPDGQVLATASSDKTVRLWEVSAARTGFATTAP